MSRPKREPKPPADIDVSKATRKELVDTIAKASRYSAFLVSRVNELQKSKKESQDMIDQAQDAAAKIHSEMNRQDAIYSDELERVFSALSALSSKLDELTAKIERLTPPGLS